MRTFFNALANKISTSIFDEELAYTQKEYEELLKEIEEIYPDYYKEID